MYRGNKKSLFAAQAAPRLSLVDEGCTLQAEVEPPTENRVKEEYPQRPSTIKVEGGKINNRSVAVRSLLAEAASDRAVTTSIFGSGLGPEGQASDARMGGTLSQRKKSDFQSEKSAPSQKKRAREEAVGESPLLTSTTAVVLNESSLVPIRCNTTSSVLARLDAILKHGDEANVPILILMVGAPGAGKTSLVQRFCIMRGGPSPYVYINMDTLGSHNKCLSVTRDAARKASNIVVDNTNPTKARRLEYRSVVHGLGYLTVCIAVMTPLPLCKERNAGRKGMQVVPESAYTLYQHGYEAPSLAEGWDEILVLR